MPQDPLPISKGKSGGVTAFPNNDLGIEQEVRNYATPDFCDACCSRTNIQSRSTNWEGVGICDHGKLPLTLLGKNRRVAGCQWMEVCSPSSAHGKARGNAQSRRRSRMRYQVVRINLSISLPLPTRRAGKI